jgi:hypothetical protein
MWYLRRPHSLQNDPALQGLGFERLTKPLSTGAKFARQLALEVAKSAEAVAPLDTEARQLANTRATTVIGLKLTA